MQNQQQQQQFYQTGYGDIRIVILQRGWIFIGRFYQDGPNCRLENAKCIRNWGTTRGLGEIAMNGPTETTRLDDHPTVMFHELTVVASVACDSARWTQLIS